MYATAVDEFDNWSATAQASLRFIGTTSFALLVVVLVMCVRLFDLIFRFRSVLR
jgi:hypothetical protein